MGTSFLAADAEVVGEKSAACRAAAESGELVVIADFDRTITRCFMPDKQRCTSAHGVLEDAPVLSQKFRDAAKGLFAKYYPIEIDATMSIEEKIPIMNEWYGQVHEHMLKETVTCDSIRDAVAACKTIEFRDGIPELIRACQDAKPPIPLLIMSAGLGDIIEEFFRQKLPFRLAPTTVVVSNRMEFSNDGRLIGFSAPLLHMFNKTAVFMQQAARDLAKDKRQCLLLGDSVGDLTMADGLEVETFKVGFLNDNPGTSDQQKSRLEKYTKGYHVVVTEDRPVPDIVFSAIGVDRSTLQCEPHWLSMLKGCCVGRCSA